MKSLIIGFVLASASLVQAQTHVATVGWLEDNSATEGCALEVKVVVFIDGQNPLWFSATGINTHNAGTVDVPLTIPPCDSFQCRGYIGIQIAGGEVVKSTMIWGGPTLTVNDPDNECTFPLYAGTVIDAH